MRYRKACASMVEGVKIYDLERRPDEMVFFVELLRKDWEELLEGAWIVQADENSSSGTSIC